MGQERGAEIGAREGEVRVGEKEKAVRVGQEREMGRESESGARKRARVRVGRDSKNDSYLRTSTRLWLKAW